MLKKGVMLKQGLITNMNLTQIILALIGATVLIQSFCVYFVVKGSLQKSQQPYDSILCIRNLMGILFITDVIFIMLLMATILAKSL